MRDTYPMTTTNTKRARAKKTGQYMMDGGFDRVCARCGGTLGQHEYEAPHANYDLLMGPECEGFRAVRTKKTAG